jgi:hypothetical protein
MSFAQRINGSTSTDQPVRANISARHAPPPDMNKVNELLFRIINPYVCLLSSSILLLSLLVVSVGVAIFISSSIVWLAITLMGIGSVTALVTGALVACYWVCLSMGRSRVASYLNEIDTTVKSEEDKLALEGKAHRFEFLDLFPERQNLAQGSMAKELIVSPLIRKLEREKVVYSTVQEFNKLSLPKRFRGMLHYWWALNYLKNHITFFASVTIAKNDAHERQSAYRVAYYNFRSLRAYILGLCESSKEADRNFGKFLFDSSMQMLGRCEDVTYFLSRNEISKINLLWS